MCGINGFNWKDTKTVKEMNKRIRHRGPDGEGTYVKSGLSLGHLRLAIIDPSKKGKQPMGYSKGKRRAIIVYNGEIYNFKELKRELKKKGHTFKTKTDTEVILASYLEYGFDCVERFNGMWAFCIYDLGKRILFCSRDRLGQKPLYYYNKGGKFVFSSELKGILAHENLKINRYNNISTEGVELFFSAGFIPAPYTVYKNVFKLEARQNLVFNLKTKKIRKWYYYEPPKYSPETDKVKLIEDARELLNDSVKLRLVSDVPLGSFLSGGVDSTATVGYMARFMDLKKLHTFSIGFQGEYDESRYIEIARKHFKTIHHHDYFTEDDFDLEKLSWIYDEPFGDHSGFPTYKVSKNARKHITVSLSGDGGDEIFGGYMTPQVGAVIDMVSSLPFILRKMKSLLIPNMDKLNMSKFKELFRLSTLPKEKYFQEAMKEKHYRPNIYNEWTTEKLAYCLEKTDGNLGEAIRLTEQLFYTLPDQFLVKVDRASMANALEVRSPFLDYRWVEFALRVPTNWKVSPLRRKILMKSIVQDIVPKEISDRKKQGFSPPMIEWASNNEISSRFDLHKKIDEFEKLGVFSSELSEFLRKSLNGKKTHPNYKVRLMLFIVWAKRWIAS